MSSLHSAFFYSAYCVKFLFIIDSLSAIFDRDYCRCCRFMFLTPFVKKSQCCWRGN